jgi:zinc-binding alcohol dehydrogenase family protein
MFKLKSLADDVLSSRTFSGENNMKAIGYRKSLPIEDTDSLLDIELPVPVAHGHDLLVQVHAVSVNPVDTKVRMRTDPAGEIKVLGYDAAGIVKAVGENVTLFKPGDEIFYAGSIDRPGSNAQFQLVDERIVGRKPASLSFAEAASLPLTSITAWELLFERLKVSTDPLQDAGTVLIVGGAGGVGSIAAQLARAFTNLTVISTASRPETKAWVQTMGAHHVVDHRADLVSQVREIAPAGVDHILGLTATNQHFDAYAELLNPHGSLGLIDDLSAPVDIMKLKRKSISLHWELMFTKPLFGTADMISQHQLLNQVARLVDEGRLRHTVTTHLSPINADNLKKAHALQETAKAFGKTVLSGFADS